MSSKSTYYRAKYALFGRVQFAYLSGSLLYLQFPPNKTQKIQPPHNSHSNFFYIISFSHIFFNIFVWFLFIIYIFYTITVTPNPYP